MSEPHFHIHLGQVPTGRRSITPVPQDLLSLVPAPTDKVVTEKAQGADPIKDTVPLIKKKVRQTLWQTKKLAKKLTGASMEQTVRNDWDFIFNHIQYVKDIDGVEQVRSPRKLIYDGKGDCDCFTVCLSSLLSNQGIDHSLRVTRYDNSSDWSHIYIVVPSGQGYITVDPVPHRFNYEVPYSAKKDFPMKLESLDGIPQYGVQDDSAAAAAAQLPYTQIYLFPNKSLKLLGLMKGSDFLDQTGLPYQEVKINGMTVYQVTTPSGLKQVAAWVPIAPDQQASLMEALNAPAQSTAAAPSVNGLGATKAGTVWKVLLGIGAAMAAYKIFSGPDADDAAPVTAPTNTGVSGLGAPAKKRLASVRM